MTLDELIQSIFRPQQPMQPVPQSPGDMVRTAPFGDMPAPDSGSALETVSYAGGPKTATKAKPPVAPNTGLSEPSTMDQIGNFLAGLGRGGGALLPAIGGGMQTVRAAEQSATANNKTFQALIGAGVDRTVAEAAISNPQLMDALLKQKFGGGKYGKTGAIFQDQDGTFKSAQFAEDGNIKITPLPGLEPARGVVTVDDGTGTQIRSKASGREVTRVPKDIAGREAQEEIGKATGKAAANLPLVMAAADRITSGIDKVLNDPYLPSMTGPVAGRLPNLSADANRVQSYVDQIQGGTFLQAYNDLRGGGAITEKEGEKATAAYNRLANMKVEDKDYRAALNEFRSEILKLRDLAIKKAQGGAVAAPGGWSVQEVK